jgi:hypothetical protein
MLLMPMKRGSADVPGEDTPSVASTFHLRSEAPVDKFGGGGTRPPKRWRRRKGVEPSGDLTAAHAVLKTGEATGPHPPPHAVMSFEERVASFKLEAGIVQPRACGRRPFGGSAPCPHSRGFRRTCWVAVSCKVRQAARACGRRPFGGSAPRPHSRGFRRTCWVAVSCKVRQLPCAGTAKMSTALMSNGHGWHPPFTYRF